MRLQGKLYAESPIYRGNARKTLFTRDGDGAHRLVSLAGEISGTAQSLMDAFIGQDRKGRNSGLLNQLWYRLYSVGMPKGLISKVSCQLRKESYARSNFFDLRMGIKLDEDRWAAEANANYKMETVFRNSAFDLILTVDDNKLKRGENQARLYYLLQELIEGRFWFGAGKSKGLGRLKLEMKIPFSAPETPPELNAHANHLTLGYTFDAENPVLVGWNWGKVDPDTPSFAAVEGHLLVGAMRNIPDPIRERLEMTLGGPILNPDDWKRKLSQYLPRVIAIQLQERADTEVEILYLTSGALAKLGKGRHGLSKKVMSALNPLVGRPFDSEDEATETVTEALGDKANMTKRVLKAMTRERQTEQSLDEAYWQNIADGLGLDPDIADELELYLDNETELTRVLSTACQAIFPRLYRQVDQQVKLLQSDSWVDAELANREEHLLIKVKLREGKITERQWEDRHQPPQGVSAAAWREFLDAHRRVRFRHMLDERNLGKSITNDRNFIAFLKNYRSRTRQELGQDHHLDFRSGGASKRDVSRKYGKPYDTVFMRMLSWTPSASRDGAWEVYVPGSTIKGAFKKRASQILRTLWGEDRKTQEMLELLFGKQGQRGMILFADAHLVDPADPDRSWCSMDGVKMDPKTGAPLESAKSDFLYAYGKELVFKFRMDIQDIAPKELDALFVVSHLLQDFARGDIPLGGEKTSGFGWVNGKLNQVDWLTADPEGAVSAALFSGASLAQQGAWHRLQLKDEAAAQFLQNAQPLDAVQDAGKKAPRASAGFISHRAFGGNSGMLFVEAEILTPTSIRESGQPSFTATLNGEPVNGWDFFSMSPPAAEFRPEERKYALPSKSLRGMLRHIYAIASDSGVDSPTINKLNPADSLFGWVGRGQNQAIAGRVSIGFGYFNQPELAWYKVPYPYGEWRFNGGQWTKSPGGSAEKTIVKNTWRIFPHAPICPGAQQLASFEADSVQASYFRAISAGAKASFAIRFWNLEDEELQRLVWTVALEDNLAHKIGHERYLGFGSLRLNILPHSYLIDWSKRYAGGGEDSWQQPLDVNAWRTPQAIKNHAVLQRVLNAGQL